MLSYGLKTIVLVKKLNVWNCIVNALAKATSVYPPVHAHPAVITTSINNKEKNLWNKYNFTTLKPFNKKTKATKQHVHVLKTIVWKTIANVLIKTKNALVNVNATIAKTKKLF